ncbi:MAG: (Fe-S)-binding protein [Verrucomicrobia bacterium]|nr:(Fe-S)-binding protein [Verrucomicrobiota bacterium]
MTNATAPAETEAREMTLQNLGEFPEGQKVLSCMQCGTCAATCPYGEVMDYPPRQIITMLQAGLIEEVFKSHSLLNCVACYACMAKCPRGINLTEVLLPMVKEQMFATLTDVPAELQKALQNTLRYGNPMGESPRKRALWTKTSPVPVPIMAEIKRPVDVLWFVECYTSFHPRGQDNSRATAKLFHAAGIDFAILGNEEKCAGECARLVGEAGLFETLTDYNMMLLRKYPFKRIVTGAAHAYDAFKYQYSTVGFDFELHHTTPFFAQHLEKLKPRLTKKLDYTVTYHDSCCLGRHNGFYDAPRALLGAIPGVKLVEMTHTGVNSICCGGGGGGMWLDTYYAAKGYERLSDRRVKEALDTGADVLAVSCPYEISRFEDALKVLGADKRMVVRDVVELLAEAMED